MWYPCSSMYWSITICTYVCIYNIEREKDRDICTKIHIFPFYVATKYGKYPFSHRPKYRKHSKKGLIALIFAGQWHTSFQCRSNLAHRWVGGDGNVHFVVIKWRSHGWTMGFWVFHGAFSKCWAFHHCKAYWKRNLQVVLGVTKLKKWRGSGNHTGTFRKLLHENHEAKETKGGIK